MHMYVIYMDMIDTLKTMDNVDREILMARFDVESLYTNIPHQAGLEAMKALAHCLSQRPSGTLS